MADNDRPKTDANRRGRPPRQVPVEPSGYRITAATRRELTIAQAFLGDRTLQSVIDRAVNDLVLHLRASRPGFSDAVDAAHMSATQGSKVSGSDNVRELRSRE